MIMAKKRDKTLKITPELLMELQSALNDSIKPDFKEKKDGRKSKKKKPSNGSAERSEPQGSVPVQSEGS